MMMGDPKGFFLCVSLSLLVPHVRFSPLCFFYFVLSPSLSLYTPLFSLSLPYLSSYILSLSHLCLRYNSSPRHTYKYSQDRVGLKGYIYYALLSTPGNLR